MGRFSPTANFFGKCPAPSIATAGTAGLPSLLATSGTTPLTRDPHSQNFMVPATTGPLPLHSSPSTAVRGGCQGWFLSGDGGTDRSPSSSSFSVSLRNPLASPAAEVQQGPHSTGPGEFQRLPLPAGPLLDRMSFSRTLLPAPAFLRGPGSPLAVSASSSSSPRTGK